MANKETFYIGDNPILLFECRQPDPYRFDDSDGVPANPISAEYRMYNRMNAELYKSPTNQSVFSVADGLITLEAADENSDRGAILTIKLPPGLTDISGGYTLYLTTIYADGVRVTDNYRIDIVEYK